MQERVWRKRNPPLLGGNKKVVQPLWKTVWRFFKKLKVELLYDPAVPLLGVYPEKMKALVQKDMCIPSVHSRLFTITKTWKHTSCPSVNERMKKLWYICTVEYYSAIKNNEILIWNNMDKPRDYHTK